MAEVSFQRTFARAGISIGLVWALLVTLHAGRAQGHDSTVAIENARVIVGNGEVLEDVVVAIKGGRIVKIGKFVVPPGVEKIDAGGMTVMPGLIDAHVHLAPGGNPVRWSCRWVGNAYRNRSDHRPRCCCGQPMHRRCRC